MQKHYHLIGIGGVGMSALARILLQKGEKVSGSDICDSQVVQSLKAKGAQISHGHDAKNIQKPNAVVFSTDIPEENPEYAYAKKMGIPLLHRSELLSQLMEGYAPLLVAGTHGKTTTSSLLAHILIEAGLDPSYALGGYLNGLDSNGHYGKGFYFAVEADESDGSFLNLTSFGSILTNLEHDHMYYWKTEEALLKAFKQFASTVGSTKHFFWCYDDMLLRSLNLPGFSYGFSGKADLVIENFHQEKWSMHFDLSFQGKHFKQLEIPLIGGHNVLNAAAAFGMGLQIDVPEKSLRQSLKTFKGVGRRAEKKGESAGIEVYDDYAHHPTEIFATLRALKQALTGRRIVVAFQPHRYSRTKYCLDDFAESFRYADQVILTDIFAAKEPPVPGVTPEMVIERIKADGYNAIQFVARDGLITHLSSHLKPGDVLVTMGAGDITAVGPALLKKLV
ncbi:MAG: UDP-N-acetylmuramate--L-alanine ligase [Simkaniaceae bacterium]|nr:UDP-N-acetylmuramate--L-alanine ligase [Candidatus Sacchlamyda saccharinae]